MVAIPLRDNRDPLRDLLLERGPSLVVGLGRSGVAAANLLREAGCQVEMSEASLRRDFKGSLQDLHPDIRIHWGGHPEDLFSRFPMIVVSPGVPTDLPVLESARKTGRLVIGEMELAYRMTTMPWAGITGSNGKSTTTTLVQLFAREAGLGAAVGGNLGTPVTELARKERKAPWIVAEVSSFQLETAQRLHFRIAALLNISPDHLDRYRGMDDYVRAKAAIFAHMTAADTAVLNRDDPEVLRLAGDTKATPFYFSRKHRLENGVALSGGTVVIVEDGEEHPVARASEIALPGNHNLENALAAVAVGWKLGIGTPAMSRTLASFTGLPHRMEQVCHYRGVPIYNDSKGTNVGAAVRSLEGMGGNVILIMGGKDKGTSYQPLVELIRSKVSLLVVMGEAAPSILTQLEGLTRTRQAADMNDAVKKALAAARPGSEILFSPACSSFDMYNSYEERGDDFRAAVLHYTGMS